MRNTSKHFLYGILDMENVLIAVDNLYSVPLYLAVWLEINVNCQISIAP